MASPDIKFTIQNQLSSADFFILKETATDLTDYGLRAGGKTTCPKCGSKNAAYIALVAALQLDAFDHPKNIYPVLVGTVLDNVKVSP